MTLLTPMIGCMIWASSSPALAFDTPQALFDAYVGAVRRLDAEALVRLCDRESLEIGRLFVEGTDPQKSDLVAPVPMLAESIRMAGRQIAPLLKKIPATLKGSRQRVLKLIQLRMETAGVAWCRTLRGSIRAMVELSGVLHELPESTLRVNVKFDRNKGETILIMRKTRDGWRLSYYALCLFSAHVLQKMDHSH